MSGSLELLEPVQINILLGRIKVVYISDPLIYRGTFRDPQEVPKTMDSTRPCVYLVFS